MVAGYYRGTEKMSTGHTLETWNAYLRIISQHIWKKKNVFVKNC